jgi:hypothetical protein
VSPFLQSTSRRSAASFETAVCKAVLDLVNRCDSFGVIYADPDCGPLSDLTFVMLLDRVGIRWEYRPMQGLAEIVWPPICGVHLVQLEHRQSPQEKRFAIRHAFGHVIAGHSRDLSYSHDGHDWCSWEETVADQVALIDLVSDVSIADRLHAGWAWGDVTGWIYGELVAYGPGWKADKMEARTEQRLRLFAERHEQLAARRR